MANTGIEIEECKIDKKISLCHFEVMISVFLTLSLSFIVCGSKKEPLPTKEQILEALIYPGGREENISESYAGGIHRTIITLSTSDTITKVIKYYKSRLPSYGWVFIGCVGTGREFLPKGKMEELNYVFTKNDKILSIRMRYDKLKKETLIDILLR